MTREEQDKIRKMYDKTPPNSSEEYEKVSEMYERVDKEFDKNIAPFIHEYCRKNASEIIKHFLHETITKEIERAFEECLPKYRPDIFKKNKDRAECYGMGCNDGFNNCLAQTRQNLKEYLNGKN